MTLNWRKKEYFRLLIGEADEAHGALELLVDDLHKDKPRTVSTFLDHFGSEDLIWGLVGMLRHKNTRVAGNSAYILGTLAEHHVGQSRVLALINGQHTHTIIADLCNMLDHDDSESVMNAAGTLGTLAETTEGRVWMFKDQCIDSMISKVMMLLSSENMWTASNAALVLARLSISEDGCHNLLHHRQSQELLTRLIKSLGVDEAGKGMNAAFAVGRICDTDEGRQKLIHHKDISKMISILSDMLSSKDPGCGKNACFAVSCLAGNHEGHALLLNHPRCDVMLRRLAEQLHSTDLETSWFAAMTLRTLASQKKGCIVLRDHAIIVPALKDVFSEISPDLHDEVQLTLELLKKLEKPNPPVLQVKGPRELMVSWDTATLRSGLEITYKLYLDNKVLYKGAETSFLATNLKPNTLYTLQLQLTTDGDESQLSDPVEVTTEECAPDAPEALRILAVSTSQIRIGWSSPGSVNGGLKGYVVYNGKQQVEVSNDLCSTLSGLAPSTKYDVYVCAFNHKGKGKKAYISAATSELGKHAPGKPILNVRGRNEIHVTWSPPEFPLGRLHKFEISLNGKVIYSGTELCFTARRLVPNTDYIFKVIAVTSEGRCESEPAKKKTPKDEYNVQSTAPIFFSHPHKSQEQDTASRQTKQQCQMQSKGNRIRTPLQHKQRNANSSPCEFTESRPSTGVSSSESKSSSEEVGKIVQNCAVNNNLDRTKNVPQGDTSSNHADNTNAKYGVNHVDHVINSESEDSADNEQPHSEWKVVIRSKSNVKGSAKQCFPLESQTMTQSCEPTSRTQVSKSQRRGEPHGIREEHPRRQSGDQRTKLQSKHKNDNHGMRSLLKGTTFSDNFEDRTVTSQKNKDSKHVVAVDETEQIGRKYRGKPKTEADDHDVKRIPVASIKEGSADSVQHRERQYTFTNKKYMEVKQRQFTDSDLELRKQEKKKRAFKGNTQVKKSSRFQSLTLSQESNLQVGVNRCGSNSTAKYSPMSPSRYRSESNLSEKTNDTRESVDSNDFVLSLNGTVLYSEGEPTSPKTKGKHSKIEQPIKEQILMEEDKYLYNTLFKGKDPLTKRTPNLFPWEREGAQFYDSPYERYTEADNISKNIANLQKSYSKPLNWNPMIDPLHDKHSSSDRTAFYQRAQTFMSSHRPLLKKTLEKLPSHGPGSNQPVFTSTGNMEFPLSQHSLMSNNRYQFIPMQFRTQPLHMPGPPLHPDNPNGNLYDKGAYVRKLEAMSYLSQKKQSGAQLQTSRPPAMRYSHRESPTLQVDSPKSRSTSGLLTDAAY